MPPHQNQVATAHPRGVTRTGLTRWSLTCRFPIVSPVKAAIFVLAMAMPISFLVLKTVRIVVAQEKSYSVEPETIQRAIVLDPANPYLHFALGRIMLLGSDPGAQASAEREFQKAVSMNPASATYWAGLGKGCYSSGNQDCADYAFREAQQLAPSNPQFAWQAAVNDVVSGQSKAAIEQLRIFLQLQPDGLEQAFQLLMRGFHDPDIVWKGLLNSSTDISSKIQFLDYLAGNKDFEPTKEYWSQLTAREPLIPVAAVSSYVDKLLDGGRYEQAAAVCRYAEELLGRGTQNLVFNGNFEHDPLEAGCDWRFWQQPYITLDFSDRAAHSGTRAFRTDFTVPQNSEYELAHQYVPVVPGQTYRLSAYVRSQAITSDSGPRLRVQDPKCVTCLDVSTPGTSGTTDWHLIETKFTADPTAEMIRLSIWRPRGRSFPMEIEGQIWFDDVSLVPLPAPVSTIAQAR
jgi:tetratricopeptide (TPR) repeat protein